MVVFVRKEGVGLFGAVRWIVQRFWGYQMDRPAILGTDGRSRWIARGWVTDVLLSGMGGGWDGVGLREVELVFYPAVNGGSVQYRLAVRGRRCIDQVSTADCDRGGGGRTIRRSMSLLWVRGYDLLYHLGGGAAMQHR